MCVCVVHVDMAKVGPGWVDKDGRDTHVYEAVPLQAVIVLTVTFSLCPSPLTADTAIL